MEIMAAIAGLEALRYRCAVTVYSDSQYVVRSVMEGWAKRWRANGWRRKGTGPVPNSDLWTRLLDLCERHEVRFEWVKGHAGNPENEACDRLSVQAAQGKSLSEDAGYGVPARHEPGLFVDAEEARHDACTLLGQDAEECDVEYARFAQAEVILDAES